VVIKLSLIIKNIIGLDIGAERIKIVKSGHGAIRKAGWAVVPEGVIKQSRIESKELLTETIKSIKKNARIGNGSCALCLSGSETIIRHITLPQMNQDQIYQNVIREISGYLPANQERYNIDYRVQEVYPRRSNPIQGHGGCHPEGKRLRL
jgi:type IV pilus assembly protein PilM